MVFANCQSKSEYSSKRMIPDLAPRSYRHNFTEHIATLSRCTGGDINLSELVSAASTAQYWGRELQNKKLIGTSYEIHDQVIQTLRRCLDTTNDKRPSRGLTLCLRNNALFLTEVLLASPLLITAMACYAHYANIQAVVRKCSPTRICNTYVALCLQGRHANDAASWPGRIRT
jgi:hypothetical protein